MLIKFSQPQFKPDPLEGGGGDAPPAGAAAYIAAQLLNPQPPAGGGPPAPAPGDNPPAPQDPAFDESKWLTEKTKGRFKTAEELDNFLSKAHNPDEDPEPVKAIRDALKNGINPKDYYKIATTDFDAMSSKDKWIFAKKQQDPELTDGVAQALFDEEFGDIESLEGSQKEVKEYRLKQAVKDAEAQWRETQQKLIQTPGFKTGDEIKAELQSKAQQVADIFNSQAQNLKELSITIEGDQTLSFKVSDQQIKEALAEAQDPFAAIADGQRTPEQLAGDKLQQILYAKILPDVVKVASDRAYQRGIQETMARVNNGEFMTGFATQPQRGNPAGGSVADDVRQQMLGS